MTYDKEILKIALPSIVTNITVPLLGIVDVAITGHIRNSTVAIGAIAVGGLVFNMVYWLFNFLRMGSSGLTAQAYGRGDGEGQRRVLSMGMKVAVACGLAIICLQRPMEWMAHWIIAPSDDVWTLAVQYFRIRVWAAPAVLMLFALNGWFIGMQNSRYPLYIAVGQNLINIVVSYALVFYYDMGVEGVAIGTVVAQYLGLLAAIELSTYLSTTIVDNTKLGSYKQGNVDKSEEKQTSYQQFFTVNRDIFFRMICLIAVTTAFTSYGSRLGDTLLAVNTLLLQLFTLFSYFSDGFAAAGEAIVGKYFGQGQNTCLSEELGPRSDKEGLVSLQREDEALAEGQKSEELSAAKKNIDKVVKLLFIWGAGVVVLFTLIYALGGLPFLRLLSDEEAVIQASAPYLPWAMAIPICGIAAFMWDGVFIGLTATRQMFYSLLIGALVFFGMYEGISAVIIAQNGAENVSAETLNHVLWGAFLTYLVVRGAFLSFAYLSNRHSKHG